MKKIRFIITTFSCSLSLFVYAGKECCYGYITCKNGKVVRIKSIITENGKLDNFNFEYNDKGQLCKVLSDEDPWYISYNPLTLQTQGMSEALYLAVMTNCVLYRLRNMKQ